jgi:hypothetical protein
MISMDRRLDRTLVALVAAYAVALNTLLPVLGLILLPAASGGLGPVVICSGAGAGAARAGAASDSGAPEKPQPFCPCPGPCAMSGCAVITLPDGGAAFAEVAWQNVGPVGLRRDGGDEQMFRLGGRNLARGPPVA